MKKVLLVLLLVILVFTGCNNGEESQVSSQSEGQIENESVEDLVNDQYVDYVDESIIQTDLTKLDKKHEAHYVKFIQYYAPNGKPINILAQDQISDEQLLKAYGLLSFFLESTSNFDKVKVANAMAENGAELVMLNGSDNAFILPGFEMTIEGQPLYQNETVVVGSDWYMKNNYNFRDASFEEIFHMVHRNGIGTSAQPQILDAYQKEIFEAMTNSLPVDKEQWGQSGLWGHNSKPWLEELEREGHLEEEYYAAVLDAYYGLWGAYYEGAGSMWSIYSPKTREDIETLDPKGYAMIQKFLPKTLTYMNRVDPEFDGEFCMTFDEFKPYTHKSRYIQNLRLTGSNNSDIFANDYDNILLGNSGDNTIDGQDGYDIVQYIGKSTEYEITEVDDEGEVCIIVKDTLGREGTDTLKSIELLRFENIDYEI